MKKIGDLMQDMGFRKDAPDSLKEAFLKHLIKNATGVEIETPTEKKQKLAHPSEPPLSQLSFDFERDESRGKEIPGLDKKRVS